MMHIERVSLETIKEDIEKVSEIHHEEVEVSGWKREPDYPQYSSLEEAGKLLIHALLDDDELVGYSVDLLLSSLHYKGKVLAINDMVYIHPEYRGLGFKEKLFEQVIIAATELGAISHTINLKSSNPCELTMSSNHYANTEVVWHRILEN